MLDLWDPLDEHHKEFLLGVFRSLNAYLGKKLAIPPV
jgi:hypothetical protein